MSRTTIYGSWSGRVDGFNRRGEPSSTLFTPTGGVAVAPGGRVNVLVPILPITINVGGAPFNFRLGLGGGLYLGPFNFTVPSCIDRS